MSTTNRSGASSSSRSRWVWLVALVVVMAGCGGQATAAHGTQPDLPAATPTLTAEPTPSEVILPAQVAPQREVAATAIEAAEVFAAALVSGDLTALTLSFAPAGLVQARGLAAQKGDDHPSVTSAVISSSEELMGEPTAWSITFAVQTDAGGESSLETRWQSFPEVGWRIVSLNTGG